MNGSTIRLIVSALVAFGFYFGWAYWANSSPEIPKDITIRAALVQGGYSGLVTLGFTFVLEFLVKRFGGHCFSLAFMTPLICKVHSKTTQAQAIVRAVNHGLDESARFFAGKKIAGVILVPLMPLAVQAVLVISINWLNQTPNLWLTVAPSILFTGLYGYLYTFTLLKNKAQS